MRLEALGVPFEAREEADFSWLSVYGRVLRVYDGLTSGNLVFCMDGPYGRLKVKFAGIRTLNCASQPIVAVRHLEQAMQVYSFRHEAFPELLSCGPVNDGTGYAAVFRWMEGVCLHPYPYDPAPLDLLSRQSLHSRLRMADAMLEMHVCLAERGYAASNFHDGNLIYDHDRGVLSLCSADRYLKMPAVNDQGRMHGSGRFMAPEEHLGGERIDEKTTVYNLGMLLFELFGDMEKRDPGTWIAGRGTYETALRACDRRREARFATVDALLTSWRRAVGEISGI
ncbi:MAG: serine/threonine protein kinase [Clostridia bacterium]|nr:serine/threonine protein kinase [Clostridia bacterium]